MQLVPTGLFAACAACHCVAEQRRGPSAWHSQQAVMVTVSEHAPGLILSSISFQGQLGRPAGPAGDWQLGARRAFSNEPMRNHFFMYLNTIF